MKRKSKSKPERDLVLEEFETRDLGRDLERSNSSVVIRPRLQQQQPTSLLLAPALIEKLRAKAAKRGIGYQTMLKIIVHEHVDDY